MFVVLFVAACVPLHTPPQLDQTPGPAIHIMDRVFESEAFSLRYPAGWRVITSAAGDSPYAIFAAPDDEAVIIVAQATPPSPDFADATYSVERHIDLEDGRQVTAVLHAPAAKWMHYRPVFDTLVETLI